MRAGWRFDYLGVEKKDGVASPQPIWALRGENKNGHAQKKRPKKEDERGNKKKEKETKRVTDELAVVCIENWPE